MPSTTNALTDEHSRNTHQGQRRDTGRVGVQPSDQGIPLGILRLLAPDEQPAGLADLLSTWLATSPHLSPETLRKRAELRALPSLSEPDLVAWVVRPTVTGTKPSNNTVRQRLSQVRNFAGWLHRHGHLAVDPTVTFASQITKAYPKVYGKRQAKHAARWLTYDEAFVALPAACADGTWTGSRDQLVIRLGLLGLRRTEITGLTWAAWRHGVIVTTGKGNRIREVRPGPTLTKMLATWQRRYERELRRPVLASDPLVCGSAPGDKTCAIAWGHRLTKDSLARLLQHRATLAGIGHLSPHDLRRSAAAILHNSRTPDGGHLYDLLDIQKVLDHADPVTTQRSYLDHLDTAVKTQAGATLD